MNRNSINTIFQYVDEASDLNYIVVYCVDQGTEGSSDEFLLVLNSLLPFCRKQLKYRVSGDHLIRIPAYSKVLNAIVRAARIPFIRAIDIKIEAIKVCVLQRIALPLLTYQLCRQCVRL